MKTLAESLKRSPKPKPLPESFAEHSGIQSTAHGASIIQVETLGKHGPLLLFLCAFIAALAGVGFIFTLFELKTVSAQYEVLQYDQQALKAQLVAKVSTRQRSISVVDLSLLRQLLTSLDRDAAAELRD